MSGFSKQKDVSKGKRMEFAPLKCGDFFDGIFIWMMWWPLKI